MGSDFYQSMILPHAGIIIKICRAYTNSQEDFEDYYQEVCLQIWRSNDRFNQQCEWSTWVYKISLNVCLTYLKKTCNHHQIFASDALPAGAQQEVANFHDSSIEQLYTAIRQLSEVDRAVILLYLEEKSYQQIADIIGTNFNNIGVRIGRIKQRLNKILNRQES
ncbi:sigma-70 family RNA polymerase sigma factor [Thalassotalea litorea]|uniref:Sigma-70 family RNA polymerase sigma factor n=1 Tax=Thalassotalea litorea TaxID=2020715 RepID=A0A5R9IML9_9GAMM|nr:sigma-70 family RNA polymerase sigma factor [Thalassotalea litorea]TLU65703.1 sigma-70 family RNA polymerase sigma factor [Thalassotalea litorea]